jgi:hypothetical protein
VTIYQSFLERGYFPKELPPAFFTESFARYATTRPGRLTILGQSFRDKQTFTINGPGANNLPVTIRMYGKDYGTNGLFEKVTGQALPLIIVNGTTASQKRPGGYCPDDPFRKPVGVGGTGGRRPLSLIIRPVRRLAY